MKKTMIAAFGGVLAAGFLTISAPPAQADICSMTFPLTGSIQYIWCEKQLHCLNTPGADCQGNPEPSEPPLVCTSVRMDTGCPGTYQGPHA